MAGPPGKYNHDPNFNPLNEIAAFYEYYLNQFNQKQYKGLREVEIIQKFKYHWMVHVPYERKIVMSQNFDSYQFGLNDSKDYQSYYISAIHLWNFAVSQKVSPSIDQHFLETKHGWRYFTSSLPFELDYFC